MRRVALALLMLAGCVYSADERCGPGQALDDEGYCVCLAGMIPASGNGRCVVCGAHEVAQGNTCVCMPGYMRAAAGQPCTPEPVGLGVACDPPSMPCPEAAYPTCHVGAGGDGYCTSSGCASVADCPTGWSCDTGESPSYCKRPPTGQGRDCAAAADCEGLEASYCETQVLHQCLVAGCAGAGAGCSPGWLCCDVSALGLDESLCLPVDACP